VISVVELVGLSVICVSSLEKCLYIYIAHLLIGWSSLLSCKSSLYILDTRPLQDLQVFHSVGCLFTSFSSQ